MQVKTKGMVFHRDGGVITLETVARFGLILPPSPPHPHARPCSYAILVDYQCFERRSESK